MISHTTRGKDGEAFSTPTLSPLAAPVAVASQKEDATLDEPLVAEAASARVPSQPSTLGTATSEWMERRSQWHSGH